MKTMLKSVVGIIGLGLASLSFAANEPNPVGYWKTIDDITHQPKSILHIYETPSHTLAGQVIKIYPRPGYDQNEVCAACQGALHNKRIVGMVILNGLQAKDSHEWSDGEILDPKSGKTYHCNIRLSADGQSLNVRGYVGIPLFGRSQTWLRTTKPV